MYAIIEFKKVTAGSKTKGLPFSLYVCQQMRAKIMAGIMSHDQEAIKRMDV